MEHCWFFHRFLDTGRGDVLSGKGPWGAFFNGLNDELKNELVAKNYLHPLTLSCHYVWRLMMIFMSKDHSGTPKRRIPWGVFFATTSCRNAPEPVRKSKNEADDSKKQPMQVGCTCLTPLNAAKSSQLVSASIVELKGISFTPVPWSLKAVLTSNGMGTGGWGLKHPHCVPDPCKRCPPGLHQSLCLCLLRQHSHILKITSGTWIPR